MKKKSGIPHVPHNEIFSQLFDTHMGIFKVIEHNFT